MKKHLLYLSMVALFASVSIISSCSKDDEPVVVPDTTSPNLTLTLSSDTTIARNSIWTDPGATASDDIDGNLTASISVSGTVITGTPGVYTLTYSVSDAAGNAATTVTRTVTVSWTGAQLAGTYSVLDSCFFTPVVVDNYQIVATASGSNDYRVLFTNLSGVFLTSVYFDVTGNQFSIPAQFPNGAGSDYKVSGSGTISTNGGGQKIWTMAYTVVDVSVTPNDSTVCHAICTSL